MIKFWVNFGFIGSPVITMFHQVIYGEIVTIALKLFREVFVAYLNTVSFFLRVSFQCAKSQTETFAQRVFLCFVCTVQKRPSVQLPHMGFNKGLKHKKNIP